MPVYVCIMRAIPYQQHQNRSLTAINVSGSAAAMLGAFPCMCVFVFVL